MFHNKEQELGKRMSCVLAWFSVLRDHRCFLWWWNKGLPCCTPMSLEGQCEKRIRRGKWCSKAVAVPGNLRQAVEPGSTPSAEDRAGQAREGSPQHPPSQEPPPCSWWCCYAERRLMPSLGAGGVAWAPRSAFVPLPSFLVEGRWGEPLYKPEHADVMTLLAQRHDGIIGSRSSCQNDTIFPSAIPEPRSTSPDYFQWLYGAGRDQTSERGWNHSCHVSGLCPSWVWG